MKLHRKSHNFPRPLLLDAVFGEREFGIDFSYQGAIALTISLSSETSGEIPEVEVHALTFMQHGEQSNLLDNEPPRSILTWDDLVSKFINKFFPPSKTTNLRNEITSQGPIYQPQVNQPPAYQAPVYQAPAPQTQGVSKTDFDSYVKANDAVMRNVQNQGQNLQAQLNNLATSNQRLESITTPNGVAYQGPTIPSTSSSSPKVMNCDTEVTKDTMLPTNNGSIKDVQPPVIQVQSQNPTSEPVVDPVIASKS
ncbi:hypothetical protein Tco_1406917 [Tanacetum coccineum]